MSKLYTVNKSPFERPSLETCLRLATQGGAVLLIEDGVYAALAGTAKSSLIEANQGKLTFYVLESDLDARGLADRPLIGGVDKVDYGGFVDLVEKHDAVHAWL
ncbi:MAG: sulfurtransferase complex subunit TusB [Rhodospirillaceae bacterium]|jgi:tRNA 2-thiouridine synthesizing protein B